MLFYRAIATQLWDTEAKSAFRTLIGLLKVRFYFHSSRSFWSQKGLEVEDYLCWTRLLSASGFDSDAYVCGECLIAGSCAVIPMFDKHSLPKGDVWLRCLSNALGFLSFVSNIPHSCWMIIIFVSVNNLYFAQLILIHLSLIWLFL